MPRCLPEREHGVVLVFRGVKVSKGGWSKGVRVKVSGTFSRSQHHARSPTSWYQSFPVFRLYA